MGKRGPPPKPTHLRLLTGNPGKRRINTREPQPPRGAPNCPTWLSVEAKAEWRRVCPVLSKLGLVTKIDATTLAAYCQAHAELVKATKILDDEGRMLKSPRLNRSGQVITLADGKTPAIYEVRVHPMVKLQRDAFARVKQFLSEFGLSPASRVRLTVGDPPAADLDPIEELIKRNRGVRSHRKD